VRLINFSAQKAELSNNCRLSQLSHDVYLKPASLQRHLLLFDCSLVQATPFHLSNVIFLSLSTLTHNNNNNNNNNNNRLAVERRVIERFIIERLVVEPCENNAATQGE
jgi:hypothetical protein